MAADFDYFVIFAGMRTGSNFLERNLNSIPDLRCFGELYNPYFIAHERTESFLGLTLEEREKDPFRLIDLIRAEANGLAGFRLFHDHDPRVRARALADPRCAKIVLTRNPVESYVSYKMAMASDQWVLTDAKGQTDVGKITFKLGEFEQQLEDYLQFIGDVRRSLQVSGQTAFQLRYEDLQNIEVLGGLVKFLGSRHELTRFDRSLKKQNPSTLRDKVENFDQMQRALVDIDPLSLDVTPNFEPTRGPAVPNYIAAPKAGLLYMPVRSGPDDVVLDWLGKLEGCAPSDLLTGMKQKDLRQLRSDHPGMRSFTVLRHPVARAYTAFSDLILPSDLNAYAEVREALIKLYKVPLPETFPAEEFDTKACRRAFVAFLKFLKANVTGQTNVRIDAAWAGQLTALQGMATVALPDLILREEELGRMLGRLAKDKGLEPPELSEAAKPAIPLSDIYNPRIEATARAAYPRDYLHFGFSDWGADQAA